MNRIRKLMELVRQGDFQQIREKGNAFLARGFYSFYAEYRDRRHGGISVNRRIPSRYKALGSYATQSSDYRCLKQVFRAVPLRPDDVFIDVGCGGGRVLTYLFEQGFRGKAIGIELDEEVAKTAAMRVASYPNISICCGNVLEQGEMFRNATAVYLFNPFSRDVFQAFVALLESVSTKPFRLYYLNCLYVDALQDRGRWICLSSGTVLRPGCQPMPFAIYELAVDETGYSFL